MLVEPVAEAAGVAAQLLALQLQRLQEPRGALGRAVAARRAAQAQVLGQIVALADGLQRVGEPAGELLRRALGGQVVAEVAVDQRAQEVLVGEELVAEGGRVQGGEHARCAARSWPRL